jgi:hypothetical protein
MSIFFSLLKSHSLSIAWKILSTCTVKILQITNHVVINLQVSYNTIGNNICSKYHDVFYHVFLELIVNKTTWQCHLLKHKSYIFKVSAKMLWRYSIKRQILGNLGQKDYWAFICRIPCSNMKLIGVAKGLVQNFWHEHTNPSSNQKEVVMLRRDFICHETHIKYFLDM